MLTFLQGQPELKSVWLKHTDVSNFLLLLAKAKYFLLTQTMFDLIPVRQANFMLQVLFEKCAFNKGLHRLDI